MESTTGKDRLSPFYRFLCILFNKVNPSKQIEILKDHIFRNRNYSIEGIHQIDLLDIENRYNFMFTN